MIDLIKENEVRETFNDLFEKNKKINAVYDKIDKGICTYDDAYIFAKEVGNIIEKTFGIHLNADSIDAESLQIINNMMIQNLNLTASVCEESQWVLNELAEISLKPISPPKERQLNKIAGILTGTADPKGNTDPVTLVSRATKTMTMALVDEWIKTNADFQADAGLDPIIVREWDGTWGSHDTQKTDYCSKLEGTYKYSAGVQGNFASGRRFFRPSQRFNSWSGSRDLFKRHEGCQCKITYYPNENVKGKITALAKGEKDTNKELWNTGETFSNSRQAVLRRRRNKYGKDEARRMLNDEWVGGRNGLAERHFK